MTTEVIDASLKLGVDDKTLDFLSKLADTIGVSVSQVFEILVKAQPLVAYIRIAQILSFIVGEIIIAYLFLHFLYKGAKMEKEGENQVDKDHAERIQIAACVLLIAGSLVLLFTCIEMYGILMKIYAPEYCALQDLGNIASNLMRAIR